MPWSLAKEMHIKTMGSILSVWAQCRCILGAGSTSRCGNLFWQFGDHKHRSICSAAWSSSKIRGTDYQRGCHSYCRAVIVKTVPLRSNGESMYHHGIVVNCVEKQTFSQNFTNFVLKSFWTTISAFPCLHVPLHVYILTQNYAQYKVTCINLVHLENRLESVSGFTGPVHGLKPI